MKNYIFILLLMACLSVNVYASVPTENGDLESYLNEITYGVKDDGRFKIPSPGQITEFEKVVSLVLQGSYELANTTAQQLDYELVAYTDTISTKLYYILRETNPIPSPLANGGGTYIFHPTATYNVAIHAPHPKYDTNTNKGAISAFLASDVRYFMLAGAHRRSHPEASTCQNFSDYRPSDAVHNTAHYFYIAHKAMEDFDNTIHYVELHGYSGTSFDNISSQCDTGGNSAVANISDTRPDADADEHTLLHSLVSLMNSGTEIRACIYSPILDTGPNDIYTRSLGGTTNTLGRYTNGSPSVCDQAALTANNTHRYVHLEQSWDIRTSAAKRGVMAAYISQAIQDYYEGMPAKPFEINVGLNDAWYDPVTDGQGFFITIFPELGAVSLAWFTYDTELPLADAPSNLGDAGHRWLTALGPIDGNKSLMNITMASGGLFDTATGIDRVSDGNITLTFNNCNSGTVVYDITSIGQTGTMPIRRVANDNIALCEALRAGQESLK